MAGGAKIKLFKYIHKIYEDIGLIRLESNENRNTINSKNWFILFCLAQFFASTALYVLFDANSAIEYGMVFFSCTTIALAFILYLILIWRMKNILFYIENCERFIEKRMHSTMVYKDTNEKIERLTELSAYAMSVSAIIVVLPSLLDTIVRYYFLDAGEESFLLFFPTWWPFDWKTPIGYLAALFGEYAGIAAILINIIPFFNIIFGSSWLFVVIAENITNDTAAFNNTVGAQKNRKESMELMERFCDIIQNYSDAKQLTKDFNESFEYSLFTFFSWEMLAISSLLITLQFQLWDDDSKILEVSILSMFVLWTIVLNLVVCEPGERVTNQFDEFGMEFGRCEWNKLPIQMQRMYMIFLSDTQQPKNIRSYGGISCTRDTFKQITNKGFSYFMTLRRFRA